jgi:NADH dehydrogenase
VEVILNKFVKAYDGTTLSFHDGSTRSAGMVIWAAGIIGQQPMGLPEASRAAGNRIRVNDKLMAEGTHNVFAVGDIAFEISDPTWPKGHPQVAQVAIQMGKFVAQSLTAPQPDRVFKYKDLGSMATIGRNKAVVDLPGFKMKGFLAWLVWMFIHLISLVGYKNRIFVLINWIWSYFSYDQSLRLLIKPWQGPSASVTSPQKTP